GYITVMRVDTDGRIRMIFPRDPWVDNFARGGRTFEVLDRDDRAFSVDDYPGVGYIFAISSPDPFHYDEFVRGDHWDYRLIADGRVRGDPYEVLTDFASRIVGPGVYDYDIVPYYVEKHYDYPRFLCYDCHSYASYSYWDPYRYSCNKFRIVIYDDYYYYPYRYLGARRVVVRRPIRLRPRFVFRDYERKGSDYVTRIRNRPEDDGRRIVERDRRTSEDIGGRGRASLPADVRRRVNDDGRSREATATSEAEDRRRATEERRRQNPTRTDPGDPVQPTPRREVSPERPRPQVEPRREEPRRVEPRREEPRRTEPQRAEPRRAEPSRAEPRRAEPRRAEPRRAEPRRAEPRRAEPRRAEPRRAEPRRAEPRRSPQPTGEPRLKRRRPG
ncbi:MAG: hypothetical protein ACREL6_04005, partial [Gemmatimonadales bacterium]